MTDRHRNGIIGARVLLVDDNVSTRLMIALRLQSLGCRVVEAGRGDEAVRRAADGPFDLVLMDQNLPGFDGLEATRQIRALPDGAARPPIIGITAAGHDHKRQCCRAAGMDDVFDKVGLLAALPEILNRFVGRRGHGGDILNTDELDRRIGVVGRAEITSIFDLFSSDGERRLDELRQCWRDSRRAAAARLAHHLSGGAATFQMPELFAALSRLEAALTDPAGDSADTGEQLDQLDDIWRESIRSFRNWLNSRR